MTDRPESLYLSAREAAAELGISLPTLYAYVSRDLIRSEPVPDSRAKRYRAEDVRALKRRRFRGVMTVADYIEQQQAHVRALLFSPEGIRRAISC